MTKPMDAAELATLPLPERWIISRCHALVGEVTGQLAAYEFGPAGQSIYAFLWDEYADWYIEISKKRMGDPEAEKQARRTLVYVLDSCLRLLHPFMPFITEELWQRLPHDGKSLMIAPWPQMDDEAALPSDADALARFASVQALVRSVRNARAEYRVEAHKKVAATVVAPPPLLEVLTAEAEAVAMLARVGDGDLTLNPSATPDNAVEIVVEQGLVAFLPLDGLVDAKKERARLGKQQAKLAADAEKLAARLGSAGFADKAPPAVVDKAKQELADLNEQLAQIDKSLAELPPE